jgi:hypothetical protein
MRLEPPTKLERFKTVLKAPIKTPIEALRIMSEAMENATRLGEFGRAMRKGATPMSGAFSSREVTLDFARMGAQTKSINAVTAFWNAQLQGVDRAAREFKDNPLKAMFLIAASITLPSILLWFFNHDDERYKELPRWEKDIYWHIIRDKWEDLSPEIAKKYPAKWKRQTPDGRWQVNTGTISRIPKPFELGILFGSVPERILDAFFTDNKHPFKDLAKSVIGGLMPPFIPQVTVPLIEQFANRSTFFDRPIVPKYLEGINPQYQAQPFTSETAKLIGAAIGKIYEDTSFASPLVIENYIRAWTGGLGMYVLKIADQALKATGAVPPKAEAPESTLADMPVIKGFVSRFPGSGANSIRDFYDNYDDVKRSDKTAKFLRKGGRSEEAGQYEAGNPIEGIHRAMGNQFKAIRDIYANKEMTPRDKRQTIDGIYLQMIEMAKRGNTLIENRQAQAAKRKLPAVAQ